MKTLLLMRHAKSSWDHPGQDDFDRPLNKRGERDAPRMGALLKQLQLVPDLILSSSAKRARMTAELVARHCGYDQTPQFEDSLYASGPDTHLQALHVLPPDLNCVLVIGHNPEMGHLVELFSREYHVFPTAALAVLRFPVKHWKDLSLKIRPERLGIYRPKELDP